MCRSCRPLALRSPDDRSAAAGGSRPRVEPIEPLGSSWRRPHVLLARLLVRAYRMTFSAFMGRTCRYFPTCSEYTEEAITRFGLWAGFWIGLARILRCHPWGANGIDPVPDELPADSRWYRPWRYGRWTGRHITERL
ncbi:MAG: membrane protein insertion efficiency factor YidD [Phyllobacteriaceae bacterium]|nr:membrane protein insertion efficiency factor YidD [Phyllobacteriaceae bacterium]